MKMNARTKWFVFLVLMKYTDLSWTNPIYFKLEASNLTANEGSCIEINCKFNPNAHNFPKAVSSWFWMKDRHYNDGIEDFIATIIYSSDNNSRPVSPDFAGRVTYKGPTSENWKDSPQTCSISICNLKKTDSGNYSFRVVEKTDNPKPPRWATTEVNLTVTENPCLITFEKPPVVKENDTARLTCSTLSSCPSNPQIEGSTALPPEPLQGQNEQKITTIEFTADWKDDGKTFSCQTKDNKDEHLIRNVSLTVEYAPKETLASVSPEVIKKGDTVTFTCSAKGHPNPTFTWFRDKQSKGQGPEWKMNHIEESEGGIYRCVAQNEHGNATSNPVAVDVTYEPQVEVMMSPQDSEVKEYTKMTFTCNVTKSHPEPHTYSWYKDGEPITGKQKVWSVPSIQPKNGGSYSCTATNTAGTGTSKPHPIKVIYRPMHASISIRDQVQEGKAEVQVNTNLIFTCQTKAYPDPTSYSWYRYSTNKRFEGWQSRTTDDSELNFPVQRADEACYTCNATNNIGTGWSSRPLCITVLYPPTNLKLSMGSEVTEGQLITIECTVDSAPASALTLTRATPNCPNYPVWPFPKRDLYLSHNNLQLKVNATSTHAGCYTCTARNSVGSEKSEPMKLVVKYRPKDVTVQLLPDPEVIENKTLKLTCNAHSHPPINYYKWIKTTDGKSEIMNHQNSLTITIQSVSPSDSGLYSCEARNDIGTGGSQPAEVRVKYAPKYVNVMAAAEQQEPDGKSSVELTCSSHSYPPVRKYSWYRKTSAVDKKDIYVYNRPSYKVPSDKPGYYYCIAENEIDEKSSDPVELFVHRALFRALRFVLLSVIILLVILLLVFIYRHNRKKSVHRGMTSKQPCFGFLVRWNHAGQRNLIREAVTAEPFRSRDDLLPDQPCRPNAQRRQPRPDSTPASNGNFVYSNVNFPAVKQGPSAQTPVRQQQDGRTADESLNYATIHFGNERKNKQDKTEVTDVYAVVTKPPKKNEQEDRDYENVSASHAAKSPDPLDSDSDTSDDEVELNYSQVRFEVKPGHRRAVSDSSTSSDSSSSDEEKTQYSDIKI